MGVTETSACGIGRQRIAGRLVAAGMMGAFLCLAPSLAQAQAATVSAASQTPREAAPDASTAKAGGTLTLEGGARQAAPQAPVSAAGARGTVSAKRLTEAPSIDGKLDDAMWRTAAHVTKFTQQDPVEGAPATQETEVYIGYDSQKLYFGFYAHYTDKAMIRANRVERDKTDNDDIITISFDPFLDLQQGYSFSVNGYGVQGDSSLRGNTGGGGGVVSSPTATGDITWDALFATAGQLVDDGWTAEMAIPLKSLRYPSRGGNEMHRWGFQIVREYRANNETDVWSPTSRDRVGYLKNMGVLDGITNLSASRNLEVLPTFTAVQQGLLNRTTGTYGNADTTKDIGLNLKYGLTPNLTFDFTYNPDFSQIESDRQQIEVNQRFPIQYAELRPFFLEGIDTFRVQGPATFVHTRTIVDPQYAAKLTGKVGKATVGLLLSKDEAPGKVENPADAAYKQSANVVLARARWDFAPQQWVGGIYTDREFLNSYSRFGGVDAPLQFKGNTLFRPVLYFSDRLDLTGVRKKGYVVNPYLTKEGRHFYMTAYHFQISPDFATDLGFVKQTDQKSTGTTLGYKWYPQGAIVNWGPEYMTRRIYDFDGVLQNADQQGKLTVQFAKNVNVTSTFTHNMERYREVDFVKDRMKIVAIVNTNRKILFTGTIDRGDEIRFTVNPYLGSNTIYGLAATVRPLARLQSVINIDTTNFMDPRTDTQAFDVKIFRFVTTYQFTPRLVLRNILARNTFNRTLDNNVLMTYRVNSGTAFFVGYDDHYAQGVAINPKVFPGTEYERTNRAIFTKIQYLFRNN